MGTYDFVGLYQQFQQLLDLGGYDDQQQQLQQQLCRQVCCPVVRGETSKGSDGNDPLSLQNRYRTQQHFAKASCWQEVAL